MARSRVALPDDVLEQLADLAADGLSHAAIARQLGLSRHMVDTRLAEHRAEASPAPARDSCLWPWCGRPRTLDGPRRAGTCYFHLKLARGLMEP